MSHDPPRPAPPQPPEAPAPDAALAAAEASTAGDGSGLRLGFLGHVNLVFLTYAANAALVFAVSVLVARALGPEGRGVYALFLLTASIAQALLGLGLGVAAVYHLGKGTVALPRVVANGLQVTVVSVLVSGLLVLAAWPIAGDTLLDHGAPYWVFAFAVPLFLNYNFLTTVLQGLSRFVAMNVVVLVQPLVLLALVAAAIVFGDLGTRGALLAWCAATAVAIVLALCLLGKQALQPSELLRFDAASMREQVSFGMQGQIGNLIQLLNYRLDQYVVLLFVSTAGVGIYAAGVTLSQTIWFLPNAVAAVLLPRLTAADEAAAARTTPLVCRNTLFVSAIAAVGLGAVSPWLVPGLFGGDFEDAVVPLVWLLPGTVALAGSKVLTSYIFSQGRPLWNSVITAIALAVTIVADFALIPPFGVEGAAAASTIAYTAHFVLSLIAYRRLSGGSIREAVFVRGEDLRLALEMARQRIASARP